MASEMVTAIGQERTSKVCKLPVVRKRGRKVGKGPKAEVVVLFPQEMSEPSKLRNEIKPLRSVMDQGKSSEDPGFRTESAPRYSDRAFKKAADDIFRELDKRLAREMSWRCNVRECLQRTSCVPPVESLGLKRAAKPLSLSTPHIDESELTVLPLRRSEGWQVADRLFQSQGQVERLTREFGERCSASGCSRRQRRSAREPAPGPTQGAGDTGKLL